MLRSMYSAVSGLRNHQIMLDVTGNNIANVNTFGFKAGRAVFEDNLSQIVRGAAAPTPGTGGAPGVGGINPAQIGLGVRLGAITNIMNQGGLQVTNQTSDLAVQGDGFFTVQKAGATFYTRNGAFNFDTDGNLVTSNGSYVLGYEYLPGAPWEPGMTTAAQATAIEPNANVTANGTAALADTAADSALPIAQRIMFPAALAKLSTATPAPPQPLLGAATAWATYLAGTAASGPITMQSFQINPDGKLIGAFSDGSKRAFGQVALTTFNNPQGLEKVGGSMYTATTNSGLPNVGRAAREGRGTVESGTLEMSNVDLAQEFTNLIVSQRGFQANSKVVTASDEVLQDLISMKR
ncbi:MAG: flagellar hook-basal body complex protein [Austwickia sp.]|nr:flagellar hook-basal body complex protein [Austwickia sp.]MBK8436447.1 flagellar hook-basal body complex protein [Austwickia sp.]MBK9102123.1 flagellar hook-basal body complex protein [Austwickia sp.]